jgi:hypothetical protein
VATDRRRWLIDALRAASPDGTAPTVRGYLGFAAGRDSLPHSPTVFYREFGSWPEACAAAGLTSPPPRFTRRDLAGFLSRAAGDSLTLTPNAYRVWALSQPDGSVPKRPEPFIREFGSWSEACAAAGLYPTRADIPTDVLRHHGIQLLSEAAGGAKALSWAGYSRWAASQPNAPKSKRWFTDVFGSWAEALKAAGLATPTKRHEPPVATDTTTVSDMVLRVRGGEPLRRIATSHGVSHELVRLIASGAQ